MGYLVLRAKLSIKEHVMNYRIMLLDNLILSFQFANV
jgi:hypothetical protein